MIHFHQIHDHIPISIYVLIIQLQHIFTKYIVNIYTYSVFMIHS